MPAELASWRTTIAGLAVIAFGVFLIARGSGDAQVTGGALVAAGIGLVRAKDA